MRMLPLMALVLLPACSDGDPAPPGEGYRVVALGAPSTATAGARLGLTLRVEDAAGRPVAGVPVALEPSESGTASAYDPGVTDPDGRLGFAWWLAHPPGTQLLRASAEDGQPLELLIETSVFSFERIKAGAEMGCGTRGTALWCFGLLAASVGGSSGYDTPPRELLPGIDVVDFAVGLRGVCVLDAGGAPSCLQFNISSVPSPVAAISGAPPLDSIAGGHGLFAQPGYFCGLARLDRSTWCWEVEPGASIWSPARQIMGAPAFEQIGTGHQFGCGRTAVGEVWCWGEGGLGQLGNGATSSSATPVLASAGPFAELAVGEDFGCARKADGEVYCWGSVNFPAVPTRVPGLTALRLSASPFALAVEHTGGFTLWQPSRSLEYPRVYRGVEIAELIAGTLTTCMRSPEGYAYCYYAEGGGGVPLPDGQ